MFWLPDEAAPEEIASRKLFNKCNLSRAKILRRLFRVNRALDVSVSLARLT